MGERLKKCDADSVKASLADGMGEAVQAVVRPMLKSVEAISQQIGEYDQRIEGIAQRYPEMKVLTQVYGVGTLIALTYILTIEDAQRFEHSRDVGPYLGLTRKQRDSGDSEPELGISKAGDPLLRRLLVQGAHCILRQGAPDSDLKAWGMARLQNGGKQGKPPETPAPFPSESSIQNGGNLSRVRKPRNHSAPLTDFHRSEETTEMRERGPTAIWV